MKDNKKHKEIVDELKKNLNIDGLDDEMIYSFGGWLKRSLPTIGGVVGSFIPGVGTALGSMLGGLGASAISSDDKLQQQVGVQQNQNTPQQVAQVYANADNRGSAFRFGGGIKPEEYTGSLPLHLAKVMTGDYRQGGLINYEGKQHEQGGIQVNNKSEVEGGETGIKPEMTGRDTAYVLSDKIKLSNSQAEKNGLPVKYVGKSLAEVSKELNKKYDIRKNDPIYQNEAKDMYNRLIKINEESKFSQMMNQFKKNPQMFQQYVDSIAQQKAAEQQGGGQQQQMQEQQETPQQQQQEVEQPQEQMEGQRQFANGGWLDRIGKQWMSTNKDNIFGSNDNEDEPQFQSNLNPINLKQQGYGDLTDIKGEDKTWGYDASTGGYPKTINGKTFDQIDIYGTRNKQQFQNNLNPIDIGKQSYGNLTDVTGGDQSWDKQFNTNEPIEPLQPIQQTTPNNLNKGLGNLWDTEGLNNKQYTGIGNGLPDTGKKQSWYQRNKGLLGNGLQMLTEEAGNLFDLKRAWEGTLKDEKNNFGDVGTEQVTLNKIDPTQGLRNIQQGFRTSDEDIRRSGASLSQMLAMRMGSAKQEGDTVANYMGNVEGQNTGIMNEQNKINMGERSRVNQIRQNIYQQEEIANQQDKAQRANITQNALANMGKNANIRFKDYKAEAMEQQLLDSGMFDTKNYSFGKDANGNYKGFFIANDGTKTSLKPKFVNNQIVFEMGDGTIKTKQQLESNS